MSDRTGLLDLHLPEARFIEEIRQSMSETPRILPPAMALDGVGHALYARVASLPTFTLARAELDLVQCHHRSILAGAGHPGAIIDLNAGAAFPIRPLLSDVQRYAAVDACRSVLADTVQTLAASFPHLSVRGIVGDPRPGLLGSPVEKGDRLVILLGGALGRFDPACARLELARIRNLLEPGDHLLIGMDLARDESRLADAYRDPTGVLDAYYRNALRRMNREVGSDFRASDWDLVFDAQPSRGRVEIRFEARRDLRVDGGRTGEIWSFRRGEPLVVERAYHASEGQVAAMALAAGFEVGETWQDAAQCYGLFMLTPTRRVFVL